MEHFIFGSDIHRNSNNKDKWILNDGTANSYRYKVTENGSL